MSGRLPRVSFDDITGRVFGRLTGIEIELLVRIIVAAVAAVTLMSACHGDAR